MSEILISNIYKSFGANDILKGLTLEINKGYVYGIVGKNGCGKTTLFKIITGVLREDSGNIFTRAGIKVGYLEQMPERYNHMKTDDILNQAFDEIHFIEGEMRNIEAKLSEDAENEDLLRRYAYLQEKYDIAGGNSVSEKLKKVISGLKIDENMRNSVFKTLSGGEKTRVLLAKLLLSDTDVLLLDEPTNHLDINSAEWLEKFINSYNGTVLAISHDRYFLDSISDYTAEISGGKCTLYKGNYSAYILEKEKAFQRQKQLYDRQQKEIKRIEDRARQLHDWANNEKTHRRAFAMEKRIEHMGKIEKPESERNIRIKANASKFKGKELLIVNDLGFSYGEGKEIFENAQLEVYKNENIAVLGPNGCGKTTFLKLILGNLQPDKGSIRLGNSVKYAYLPQNVEFENNNISILETAQRELDITMGEARNILAAYNFTGEDVFKEINGLSGGEKSRLKLCLLLQKNINLLILDEPTNHLDISSREVLEDMLSEYEGSLLFVSHDRYFIRKFANIIADISDKKLNRFDGGYDGFREEKEKIAEKEKKAAIPQVDSIQKEPKKSDDERKKEKRANDPWRLKKIQEIEEKISLKEEEAQDIEKSMFGEGISYEKIVELTEQKEAVEKEIEELMALWEKYF